MLHLFSRYPWARRLLPALAALALTPPLHADEELDPDDDGDGWTASEDCDDTDPDRHPWALEVCDDIDNNCNDLIDDEDPYLYGAPAWYPDASLTQLGNDEAGFRACIGPAGWFTASLVNADGINASSLDQPADPPDALQLEPACGDESISSPVALEVTGGVFHSLALLQDGTVASWGRNNAGQLGDGTFTDRGLPISVAGITNATAIAAGWLHSLAVLEDGTVRAWGLNTFGQVGDGTTITRAGPTPVSGLGSITAVAAGLGHSLALRGDGTVWGWGDNQYGQLGDGTGIDSRTPVRVPGLTDVTAIAAGAFHSLALKSDGTVWAWGRNDTGQLGNADLRNRAAPEQVSTLGDVVAIAAGAFHSLAIEADGGDEFVPRPGGGYEDLPSGTVWAWGYNSFGQVYEANLHGFYFVTPVETGHTHVTRIAAGGYHSMALNFPGELQGWGFDGYGQSDASMHDATAIAAGYMHSLGIQADGTPWTWGRNDFGQLGDGGRDNSTTPVQVRGFGLIEPTRGPDHVLLLLGSGGVQAIGRNDNGQVGYFPNSFDGLNQDPVFQNYEDVPGLSGIRAIATGTAHSLALSSNGSVWAWGNNAYGQLGDWTHTRRYEPVWVFRSGGFTAIAAGGGHSLALRGDGTVYAWGLNNCGQLGDGTTTSRPYMAPVPGLYDVVQISAGASFSLALTRDGTLYGWGDNSKGQMDSFGGGLETSPRRLFPGYVFSMISAGRTHALGAQGNAVVGWGDNSRGQVTGTPGNDIFTSPYTVIGSLYFTDDDGHRFHVAGLAAGTGHSMVILADGDENGPIEKLYAWGDTRYNQLCSRAFHFPTDVQAYKIIGVATGFTASIPQTGGFISSSTIISAAGARDYSQLLDEDHRLTTCGDGTYLPSQVE